MHAVIFDIDGTLVDSNAVDGRCYRAAIVEELGPVEFREDWSCYPHVTDGGCLIEVLLDNGIEYSAAVVERISARFVAQIRAYAQNRGFRGVEGAAEFLKLLRESPSFSIAFATGGWRESALVKLQSAGIEHAGCPLFSSNDHCARIEIMRLAHGALGHGLESVTYYGDAPWDRVATAELGWRFEPVGPLLNGLAGYHGEFDRLLRRCAAPEEKHIRVE